MALAIIQKYKTSKHEWTDTPIYYGEDHPVPL